MGKPVKYRHAERGCWASGRVAAYGFFNALGPYDYFARAGGLGPLPLTSTTGSMMFYGKLLEY